MVTLFMSLSGACRGFLPGAIIFFAREAHEDFLTAPGKFLTAPPFFAFTWGGEEIMIK